MNLDTFQTNHAGTRKEQADATVDSRIKEVYVWLLMPKQPDPMGPVGWQES